MWLSQRQSLTPISIPSLTNAQEDDIITEGDPSVSFVEGRILREIEENDRMEKTRDLFKKIRKSKRTFHTRMGKTKDRNCVDLTEAEDIKKRWQEYTEELYKKDLQDPDNHDDVISHLEPDILECEVKWVLGSILQTKLVEVIKFQLSYFKS